MGRCETPSGFHIKAQGRASAPWDRMPITKIFEPRRGSTTGIVDGMLSNPYRVPGTYKDIVYDPGCAARPWALL
ncbi:MAG: hypothetical protein C0483_20785 [Pirellula sp.]|nr:hypothetical protein [Pirellula sp.]